MSCCDNMPAEPICPCGGFVHPRIITNPAASPALDYRVGVYTAFRHALLIARLDNNNPAITDETELSRNDGVRIVQVWRPTGEGDLALQLIEWWAYLADILTFYNERIANQDYLRTADLPESINRLICLLGYRPRPGIGAIGVVAALANGPKPFTLAKGFQIQNKPGPGKQPQVFELEKDLVVGAFATGPATQPQGDMEAELAPDPAQLRTVQDRTKGVSASVFIEGSSSAIRPGDRVMVLRQANSPKTSEPSLVVAAISAVDHEKDARGKPITHIRFDAPGDIAKITDVRAYDLWTTRQSAHVFQYGVAPTTVIAASGGTVNVHLEAVTRQIKVGDPVLFEDPASNSPSPQLVNVAAYGEVVFYANNPSDPFNPPPAPKTDPEHPPIAIPIPHTQLTFASGLASGWDTKSVLIRFGWKDLGVLIPDPTPALRDSSSSGSSSTPITLQPSDGASSFPDVTADTPILVEDAIANGASGILGPGSNLRLADPVPALIPPLRVLFNLLLVSRGKTVTNEVLGSGNTAIPGQEFVLQNAPVTYLSDKESTSGDNYSSTVRVWVNDLEWKEVRTFFNHPPNAQIFITREDELGKTHVIFGDGEQGARLPTGVNNIVASYRYGSGAEAPETGSLTVILQPRPGLKAIRNPVRVGGGADPDPPKKVRLLAPRSVLAFNRAVSAEDYEVIAAQAPSVVRARAAYAFDAIQQRPVVKIWVGDDSGAVDSAKKAVADTADPNRPFSVDLATQIVVTLGLTLVLDPRRELEKVRDAVHDALLDPDTGLFGLNVVGIGQAIYDSQVYAACLAVPGVQAIHDYSFDPKGTVAKSNSICQCNHRHNPGQDGYFFLPDDGQHLTILPKQ